MNFKNILSIIQEKLEGYGVAADSRQLVAILFLVALILVGFFIIQYRNRPATVEVLREDEPLAEEAVDSREIKPVELFIHVSGAVERPGVYQLPEDSRVIDAISRAGGVLPDADTEVINLAAPLADGQKVHVPQEGEEEPPPTSVGHSGQAQEDFVGLNSADQTRLEALPGIGPTLAGRIIDYRAQNGRFTDVEQLMEVEGIGSKRYEQLRDLVVVD